MADVRLHINCPQTVSDQASRQIALALQPIGRDLQAALDRADVGHALNLAWHTLCGIADHLGSGIVLDAGEALLQALTVEIEAQPFFAWHDATLQDDGLSVWIEHRAWRVTPQEGRRLAGQFLSRMQAYPNVTWMMNYQHDGAVEAGAVWAAGR